MISHWGFGTATQGVTTMSKIIVLSIKTPHDLENKIAAIKAVRGLTGLGLKEAKELVERVSVNNSEVVRVLEHLNELNLKGSVDTLKMSGLTVSFTNPNNKARTAVGDELRKLITYSTMAAQYDIAKALLDVVETHCPELSSDFNELETETEEA